MQILGQFATGTFTGDTAAETVTVGFTPVYVKVWNETDGDTQWEYCSGLAAGKAYKAIIHADTQFSLLASNGITVSGTSITFGTDIAENAKVFRYIAF